MHDPVEYPGELGQRIKDLDVEIAMVFAQLRKAFPVFRASLVFSLLGALLAAFLWSAHVNGFVALLAGVAMAAGGYMLFWLGWQREGFHYFLDMLINVMSILSRRSRREEDENQLFERMRRLDLHRGELVYQITRKKQPSKTYVGTLLLLVFIGMLLSTVLTAVASRAK